ncbi:hypothetical protein PV08_03998 [Exophiala spinifera]|uniref:Uncharacterized protein n=1 Tax=Exophiala spinifera TaxID=91928 RepID=A0A0D2BCW5_9EURO|nr:uncharacterized protein PV08_03998 [Exophiala spinifera]KIW16808.1 hypothetical protein PV08_03998 [Exophiala spinifera]
MPTFSISKHGISREVLETDLPLYLGRDARVVNTHDSDRYVIEASLSPPSTMIPSLRDDSARWYESNGYRRRNSYAESSVHRERRQSFSQDSGGSHRYSAARRDSNVSRSGTSYAIPAIAIPQRPNMMPRYSSNSSSVMESVSGSPSSTFGSPPSRSGRSYSYSTNYTSSRRPSDAMASLDEHVLNRADSSSSESSDYGIDGILGFEKRDARDARRRDGHGSGRRDHHRSSRSHHDRR